MRSNDRGFVTVLGAALIVLLLIGAVVAMAWASVVIVRMRASTVADLAAIAAVHADGCAAAEQIASANDMSLSSCDIVATDVVVEVAVAPPALLSRLATWVGQSPPIVTAAARAGWPEM